MLLSLIEILIFSSLLLLSFVMLTNPLKVNKKANLWFGIMLLLWASFWLDEIIIVTDGKTVNGVFAIIISFIQFSTALVFYLCVVFFTNPNYKFKPTDFRYLVLPTLYLATLLVQETTSCNMHAVSLGLVIVHSLFFTVRSYLKIRKHQKQIKLFSSNTTEIDLKWLEHIIIVTFVIALLVSIFNIVYYGLPLNLYINIMMLGTVLFIVYNALKQKEIFPLNEKHRKDVIHINENEKELSNVTKRKLLKDEELITLKSRLSDLMKKEHLYLDHDINLASLSEQLDISPHQLSYVINTGFNENFFQFINGFRVEKAKSLLMDKTADKLSILGIAFESGFSSKTAFNTTFKKITGKTPSEFKKQGSGL